MLFKSLKLWAMIWTSRLIESVNDNVNGMPILKSKFMFMCVYYIKFSFENLNNFHMHFQTLYIMVVN